ncbi:hypothetical protein Tco_0435259 [Tanacetum coccineum]
MRIEESLNVTFDESLLVPKSPPSVEDDRIIEPLVQNSVRCPSLEVNASEPGYPKSLKEARGHLIEQVIAKKELPIIVGYMLFCIETHTPFNFAYFLAKRMDGMEFNKDQIPFARIIIKLVEFIKNEHPEDTSRVMEVDDVLPMSVPFTMDSIVS